MQKRSYVLEILAINNQFVVALLENGRCTVHNLRKFILISLIDLNFRKQGDILLQQIQQRTSQVDLSQSAQLEHHYSISHYKR